MPQEPWKQAARLSQRKRRPETKGSTLPPGFKQKKKIRAGCVFGWVFIILLIAGTAVAYFSRGYWLPRVRDEMPEPVRNVVEDVAPEPRADIDTHALENGLGAELIPFSDYLNFVGVLGDWGVEPKLISMGENAWKISTKGFVVYVKDGYINTYDIDLKKVFSAEELKAWYPDLTDAGLTPDLTWTAFTGEEEMPEGHTKYEYESPTGSHIEGGWVHPVFMLHFNDGWLRRIELQVRHTASDDLGPDQ